MFQEYFYFLVFIYIIFGTSVDLVKSIYEILFICFYDSKKISFDVLIQSIFFLLAICFLILSVLMTNHA